MTRPTARRTFHYDVTATVTALVAGIALQALTPGTPFEWVGKILFAGGLLTAVGISVVDATRRHLPEPNAGDARD